MTCITGLDPDSIRAFLSIDSTISDQTMSALIAEAKRKVIIDGISETSDYYIPLVRYAVGVIAVKTLASGSLGNISGDSGITEEKIGDVSVKYGNSGGSSSSSGLADIPGGGYEHSYNRILRHATEAEIIIV